MINNKMSAQQKVTASPPVGGSAVTAKRYKKF